MKRVPVLIPPQMLDWIDAQTAGVENRATFIRRLIAEAMKRDNAQP
jgi:metal-responsive CopG/Arc/MetJ family transcriptional regulator